MKATEDHDLRKKIKEVALKQQLEAMTPMVDQETRNAGEEKLPINCEAVDIKEDDEMVLHKPVYVTPKAVVDNFEDRLKVEHKEQAKQMLAPFVKRESDKQLGSLDEERGTGPFDPRSVDDTDGINPEVEEEAWRLRELQRYKRDRDERERWEREKLELERIRNMTAEERSEMDRAKLAEWETEQANKSNYRYLQKYYHKGAFFQEDELLKRDYNQPTGTDAMDREQLPSVMQVRNFGKKGRTKWKHLTAEDTTNFEFGWGHRKNSAQYRNINRMGGMRGDLEPPSKRPKQ